jgi:hypothetical protein
LAKTGTHINFENSRPRLKIILTKDAFSTSQFGFVGKSVLSSADR